MSTITFEIYYDTSSSIFFKVLPTTRIGSILNALRDRIGGVVNWDRYSVSGIGNYDGLDSTKTVGDYGIKSGDILRFRKITDS